MKTRIQDVGKNETKNTGWMNKLKQGYKMNEQMKTRIQNKWKKWESPYKMNEQLKTRMQDECTSENKDTGCMNK